MSKSTFLRGTVLAATLAVASAPALAVKPFSANYQANYMGMAANGRMSVEPAGDGRWKYTLQVTNKMGNLVQSTVFEDVDDAHDGGFQQQDRIQRAPGRRAKRRIIAAGSACPAGDAWLYY